jgi:hypothetical protein
MRTATVNEGLIRGLVNDPGARSKFGFLRNAHRMLTPQKKSCCGRRARSSLNVRVVKTTILGMANSELQKFKDHLGVDKLVFFMPGKDGGSAKIER